MPGTAAVLLPFVDDEPLRRHDIEHRVDHALAAPRFQLSAQDSGQPFRYCGHSPCTTKAKRRPVPHCCAVVARLPDRRNRLATMTATARSNRTHRPCSCPAPPRACHSAGRQGWRQATSGAPGCTGFRGRRTSGHDSDDIFHDELLSCMAQRPACRGYKQSAPAHSPGHWPGTYSLTWACVAPHSRTRPQSQGHTAAEVYPMPTSLFEHRRRREARQISCRSTAWGRGPSCPAGFRS